jgi:hypothetical protein
LSDKDYQKYAPVATSTTVALKQRRRQDDTTADDIQRDQAINRHSSIMELASVWSELAQGRRSRKRAAAAAVNNNTATAEEASEGDEVQVTQWTTRRRRIQRFTGPIITTRDLIESVLLRNASYPGHWDAGDSI